MGDRKVKVTLSAQIAEYKSAMESAAKATRNTADEAAKLAESRKHFDMLGKTALAAGGLIAVGLAVAIGKFAEFDEAMSHVQAATHESAENMQTLSDAAIKAGADSVFSAKEAANAIEELAKAGIHTEDILNGGLNGSLDLAAAGGIGVADAAGIAATALNQFGLTGDKTSHVADLLAAGAGKASGDVSDLAQALNQGGLVANQFGLSIDETTGTLAAFASNGLLGSDAGTSFKTMLQRLVPQSKQAQQTMDALGLSAFDSSGKFVGMANYAGKLKSALGDMDEEQQNTTLSVLFGSDAVRAATVLLNEGSDGIQGWIDKVDDQGYAAETAALKLDNLKGDIEFLQGAVDSAAISMGEAADGPLRVFVQGLTGLVDVFNDMPADAKQAVFWVGAVTAAVLVGGGTFLLAIPKIAAYKASIALLGPAAQRASAALGTLAKAGAGIAIGAAATAAGADLITKAIRSLGDSAEVAQNNVKTATNATELFAAAMNRSVSGSANMKAIAANVKNLARVLNGENLGATVTTGVLGNVSRLSDELATLASTDAPAAARQFRLLAEATHLTDDQQFALLEKMPAYKKAVTEQATANEDAANKQNLLKYAMGQAETKTNTSATAYQNQADRINGVRDALKNLTDQINADNDAQLKAITSKATFVEGLGQLKGQVKENGDALDLTSKKGLANSAMLGNLATDAQEAAQAQYELDQKTMGASEAAEKYADNLANQRKKLEDTAVAAGFSKDEVKKLLDVVFKLPDEKSIKILADTSAASDAIAALKDRYNNTQVTLKVKLKSGASDAELGGLVGIGVPGQADGGSVVGPGTGTSDSIPTMLSNGEHVWTAAEVAAAGGQGAMYAMRAQVRQGAWRGFAGGGAVGSSPVRERGDVSQTFNIYPQAGPSADEIARAVANKQRFAMRTA